MPSVPNPVVMSIASMVVLVAACATTGPTAGFREVQVEKPALPAAELFNVCFKEDAVAPVKLMFMSGEVLFESQDNSAGRCMREIADMYPWGEGRPSGELVVKPAKPSGWAVLAWVKLLAPTRFGPERGLLDPAALVASCLTKGPARPGVAYAIRFDPALRVSVLPAGALTDGERCVEAVLGATAWPSTRPFTLELGTPPAGKGDVSHYFVASEKVVSPIDPQRVHDAMMLAKPLVAACWEAALNRRAGISGGRTVRISVDDSGAVTHVSMAANATDARSTAADYLLDLCLVQAVKSARFGPGAGDTAYSWVFGDRAG
ncbi:MAG: hypothetical protein JNK82_19170 [Myxococcaceae bacterium]|nr:hypothetical protein [Myxococcaceae bacterium]